MLMVNAILSLLLAASAVDGAYFSPYVFKVRFPSTSDPILNLAEIQAYAGGILLTPTSYLISPEWSSFPASNCFDGDINTYCSSTSSTMAYIQASYSQAFDTVIIYNRQDCCQSRLVGGDIVAYDNLAQIGLSATVSTASLSYGYVGFAWSPTTTLWPTALPSLAPTSASPSVAPTASPTNPTSAPTTEPTSLPSVPPTSFPSVEPTTSPTNPTANPTTKPTANPSTSPTAAPTRTPTAKPTATPTVQPTAKPTATPTANPTVPPPTAKPTTTPTATPTTATPSRPPTVAPSAVPSTLPTAFPTTAPTTAPTVEPSAVPTASPSSEPTVGPTASPTSEPTVDPTTSPTSEPSADPTSSPSSEPSASPTATATEAPTTQPTSDPTASPTNPTAAPTLVPTTERTAVPTPRRGKLGFNYGRNVALEQMQMDCMRDNNNMDFFVSRGYATWNTTTGIRSGVDPHMCKHLRMAVAAGLEVRGVYVFAKPIRGLSAEAVISDTLRGLRRGCNEMLDPHSLFGEKVFVWLTVLENGFKNNGWLTSAERNRAWFEDLAKRCKHSFSAHRCGVLTSAVAWASVFGDVAYYNSSVYEDMPLWYSSSVDSAPNFKDYLGRSSSLRVGNWKEPTMKQFTRQSSSDNVCGIGAALNWVSN